MADMLSTGVSGLLASQLALSTTSNNIANAGTDGYSRQNVEFSARPAQNSGSYYVGRGVDVADVQRSYSQYLNASLQQAGSDQSRAATMQSLTDALNNALSGTSNLQTALDGFYGSVNDLANAPADTPTRQALLGKATTLTSTFHTLDGQFRQLGQQVNQRISDAVDQINGLSANIAKLNAQIQRAGNSSTPNDLLDARDTAVRNLADDIGVQVVSQSDGTINVFAGNGQALVTGTSAFKLETTGNTYDAGRTEVTEAASGQVVSGQIGGGKLGALLGFRDQVLTPTQNQLGRTSLALSQTFNAQNRQGVDLNGQLGGDFFSNAGPTVHSSSGNTGGASVQASISDISGLAAADYVLRKDASGFSLTTRSGQPVALSGSGTAIDPFTADGLSFTVSGTANAGDSFLIQPSKRAGGGIELAISDTNKIAAASALTATSPAGNTATAGDVSITDSSNPALLGTANIAFTSATSYTVNGGPTQSYTPGNPLTANGFSLTFNGAPASGDTFQVKSHGANSGDNSNALALAKVADKGVLDNNKTTASAAYSQLATQVGSAGQQAQTQLDTQNSILQQATQSQQSVSGVNLDEEAANLVRFQQSYQASAKIISTASTLFNTLISAIGN